jgi:hypothetical protein
MPVKPETPIQDLILRTRDRRTPLPNGFRILLSQIVPASPVLPVGVNAKARPTESACRPNGVAPVKSMGWLRHACDHAAESVEELALPDVLPASDEVDFVLSGLVDDDPDLPA